MKRSKQNLSYLNSTTCNAGYLIPVYWEDCLPGDKLRIGFESFIRCQPILSPLMHQVNMYMQYWFVPYRLLWDRWTEFITGGEDGNAAPTRPYIVSPLADSSSNDPQLKSGGFPRGSFADYFFGADLRKPGIEVSALPFRANVLIWNTRYRDEDLQDELPLSLDDGEDLITSTDLLSPCVKKDYFTTARGVTQRGSQISVPVLSNVSNSGQYRIATFEFGFCVGTDDTAGLTTQSFFKSGTTPLQGGNCPPSANVSADILLAKAKELIIKPGEVVQGQVFDLGLPAASWINSGRSGRWNFAVRVSSVSLEFGAVAADTWSSSVEDYFYTCSGGASSKVSTTVRGTFFFASANLNTSGLLDVRDLRLASALQRYQERSLLWGNRYEEFLQREFNVRPSDARIQRPEFLGGCKSQLLISEVLQTAEGETTGVGTMRGNGVGVLRQRPIRFFAPEHGIVIGYLSIRPKHVYTSGIDRAWLKKTRFDFYTPELSAIGMQEVLQQEISANADNSDVPFGYQDRYQEYRFRKDRVSGEFVDLLAHWNMATSYKEPPVINGSFVDMRSYSESYKRPFLVQDTSFDDYLCMIANKVRAYRPISKRAKNILK